MLQATWYFSGAPATAGTATSKRRERREARVRQRQAAKAAAPAFRSLRVLEPAELVGMAFEVKGEATIGRAAGCEITLDDTFISQVHARISLSESKVLVEDLGSTNGTYLNRQKVTSGSVVQPGDQIQVGGTIMELQ